ncbi:hypothetical protein LY76DRAFT_200844 [Colletotrichum caudatum]|nr:hypothetical protein LY76DRAFT_200844 [Colletotrichum caudatum]
MVHPPTPHAPPEPRRPSGTGDGTGLGWAGLTGEGPRNQQDRVQGRRNSAARLSRQTYFCLSVCLSLFTRAENPRALGRSRLSGLVLSCLIFLQPHRGTRKARQGRKERWMDGWVGGEERRGNRGNAPRGKKPLGVSSCFLPPSLPPWLSWLLSLMHIKTGDPALLLCMGREYIIPPSSSRSRSLSHSVCLSLVSSTDTLVEDLLVLDHPLPTSSCNIPSVAAVAVPCRPAH